MCLVTDKVALVTGAAAGIGRATALAFAREGAAVVVSDMQVAGGKETVEQIKAIGGKAVFVEADVRQAKDVAALVATTVDTYGRLDCACNNAGIEGNVTPMHQQSADDFDRVIAVN